MNYDSMLLAWVLSILMLVSLNWAYFFNWYRPIGWLVSLFNPRLKVKEIEKERELRRNERFKKHLRKWRVRFLLVHAVFSVVYLVICVFAQQAMVAFFGGVLAVLVTYGVLENKESKERKRVVQGIQSHIADQADKPENAQ